jgi:hypothetical protein
MFSVAAAALECGGLTPLSDPAQKRTKYSSDIAHRLRVKSKLQGALHINSGHKKEKHCSIRLLEPVHFSWLVLCRSRLGVGDHSNSASDEDSAT